MNDVNTDVHQHSGHDHADGCAAAQLGPVDEPGYRRILWIALLANAGMFFVETLGGLSA
jgi:Co/Zn/Cd efflux system component